MLCVFNRGKDEGEREMGRERERKEGKGPPLCWSPCLFSSRPGAPLSPAELVVLQLLIVSILRFLFKDPTAIYSASV